MKSAKNSRRGKRAKEAPVPSGAPALWNIGASHAAEGAAVARRNPSAAVWNLPWWSYVAAGLLALVAYSPALRGAFLFDDIYLPFLQDSYTSQPWTGWLRGGRPVLYFTYWLNYATAGVNPAPYHILNLVLHVGAAWFVFLITRRLLDWSGRDARLSGWVAAGCAAVFLLHPLQTESVAYVAGRSETLSVFLAYAAVCLFLYRGESGIGWRRSLAVAICMGLAGLTKEHALVAPGALVLIDLLWRPDGLFSGIARNRRLYVLLGVAVLPGAFVLYQVLSRATTAGFNLKDFTWYQYFFSQCKAIWIYLRMFILPFGQNIDHQYPVVKSIADPAALAGLTGLLGLGIAAIALHKKYPLAAFGVLFFFLTLAPTSSVMPIQDILVERRTYLPFLGLLLALAEVVTRLRVSPVRVGAGFAAATVVFAWLTFNRASAYASPAAMWTASVNANPANARAHFHLGYALYEQGACGQAVESYKAAAQRGRSDYSLLIDWALALDCDGKTEEAIVKANEALKVEQQAHTYAVLGMLHAKLNRNAEAFDFLDMAEKLDVRFDATYVYRGNIYLATGALERGIEEYRRALAVNPNSAMARSALEQAELILRKRRQAAASGKSGS